MTKIEDFIQEAQNEANPVSKLLREAKLLAADLGQNDFSRWINLELEGYKDDDERPTYRMIKGEMKAWNPYRGWISVVHPSTEIEDKLCTRSPNQSVREIEELLSSKSDNFEMPYPTDVTQKMLKTPFQTKASLFIGRASLVGILEGVRNRLIDWASELKGKGIDGGTSKITPKEKEEAKEIDAKFNIGKIENFHGTLGEDNNFSSPILTEAESFWSKAFWYIVVALVVLIVGNVLSAIIIKALGI